MIVNLPGPEVPRGPLSVGGTGRKKRREKRQIG